MTEGLSGTGVLVGRHAFDGEVAEFDRGRRRSPG
jgi:hypothetical protein